MIKLTNREAVGFAVEALTQVYENYEGDSKGGARNCCICGGKKDALDECVNDDCNNNDFVAAIDKLRRLRERKKL